MAKDTYKIRLNEPPQQGSEFVMSLPQPPARKAEEYLKAYEGYVYTATSAIAQEVASIDLKLFKVKYVKQEPVTEELFIHPALSVLQHVNDLMTFYDLIEATQVYLELVGEAFWVILRRGNTGEPVEIWPIRPDWVKVIPDGKKVVGGYIYTPGGNPADKLTIPVENMIHFKNFHPLNPYRGKGSVQAAAMPLDIHQFAQDWNRNFFFNSAMPGMVFTSDKKFNKQAIRRFVEQWQNNYGGRANSHKIAFLGGGFKLEKTTMGARELDFNEQQKVMRDDILAVFKVPKSILGLTEDVNRANAEATTRAFMERVVTPRMRKLVGTLSEKFLPMFKTPGDYFFDFTDPSPDDVELKLKVYANARQYNWMTPNEIRVQENLEPVEGGDILGPLTNTKPTEPEPEEPADEEEDTEEEEGKGLLSVISKIFVSNGKKKIVERRVYKYKKQFKHMMPVPTKKLEVIAREELQASLTKDLTKLIGELMKNGNKTEPVVQKSHEELWTEDAKTAYWLNFIEKTTKREMLLKRRIIPVFEEIESETLAKLEEVKHVRKEIRKASVSDLLPEIEKWASVFFAAMSPILREFIYEEGNQQLALLERNQPFDMNADPVVNYFQDTLALFITGITETTREQLKVILTEGFDSEEGITQLRNRVKKVMKNATTDRANMIARTEAIRSTNLAAHEAYRQSGVVEARQWLSERDDRTCPFCEEMDGKILALEEDFFKKGDQLVVDGSTMKFEVDNVTFPPLHPLCRCTDIPVVVDSSKQYKKMKEKEKAEDVVALAEIKSTQMVEEAVQKAHAIVEKAKEHAELLKNEGAEDAEVKAQEITDNAEKEATELVKTTKKKADALLLESEQEAKQSIGIIAKLMGLFKSNKIDEEDNKV